MGLVYVLNANDYEPISFGDNYLYHQYDKVSSFLLRNYGKKYQQILAKPVLSGGVVNWHANFDSELSRIGDLNQETQNKILRSYWELKDKLDQDIEDLEYSNLPEKKKWGSILRQIFDDENNVILTSGDFWCLLWGWRFKNKSENYRPPEFENQIVPVFDTITESNEPLEKQVQEIQDLQEVEEIEKITIPSDIRDIPENKKNHFWYRIKRFFRNFVYRYWGLLLFILLILFIFCFVQKCSNSKCDEEEQIENNLIELNDKINNRCPE